MTDEEAKARYAEVISRLGAIEEAIDSRISRLGSRLAGIEGAVEAIQRLVVDSAKGPVYAVVAEALANLNAEYRLLSLRLAKPSKKRRRKSKINSLGAKRGRAKYAKRRR